MDALHCKPESSRSSLHLACGATDAARVTANTVPRDETTYHARTSFVCDAAQPLLRCSRHTLGVPATATREARRPATKWRRRHHHALQSPRFLCEHVLQSATPSYLTAQQCHDLRTRIR